MLEQYTIADILTWLQDKTLFVNKEYQRSDKVWPQAAQSYLIDTILRELPMPKIYLRTQIDVKTQRSYREVVDGQQRLMAIKSFAGDGFALRPSGNDLLGIEGRRYSDLDEEYKQKFLGYQVPVEQLLNVPDAVVFDVFQRLNTYNYNLSPQELRHGRFHGNFRNAVVSYTRRWSFIWDKYNVLGKRARLRMADDELMAQLFGIVLEGVTDGGQPRIKKLYETYDAEMPEGVDAQVGHALAYLVHNFGPVLETNLARSPHFLMLFAAVAHALDGIPAGGIGEEMPDRDSRALGDPRLAVQNLITLSDMLDMDQSEVPARFHPFQLASVGTTQRIRSRRVRFIISNRALLPQQL